MFPSTSSRRDVLALALTLGVATSTLTFSPAALAAEFVSIKGNTVNVRDKPTTQGSTVLWKLAKGYPLQVEERKGDWVRVRDFEESLGWVSAPLTQKSPHRVVKVPTANLRAGPSTGNKVVGKMERYEVLRSLGKEGNWVQVQRDNGQKGWVSESLTWGW